MKPLIFKLLPFICITLFISCNRVEYVYQIETLEISELSDSGVFFNSNIITNNISDVSEFGFIWSTDANFSLSEKKSIKTNIQSGENRLYINSSFVLGLTYYFKAFLIVKNSIIYGNPISFTGCSLPDVSILHFYPEQGTWNDTISIYGKNFNSDINSISAVKVGNISITVLFQADTVLKVIIPDNLILTQSFFSIFTEFDTVLSVKPFTLLPPEITEFTPKVGIRGTELFIKGKNFNPVIEYNSIKIGNYNLEVKTAQNNQLTSTIPQEMIVDGLYDISIVCGGQNANASEKYTQIEPWTKLSQGQVSIYHGTSINEIYFTVGPKCYIGRFNYFEQRLGKCSNYISEFDPITNNNKIIFWYLDYSQSDISIFVDNNKIYLKRSSSICEIDTANKILINKNNFPGTINTKSNAFSINNSGFIYTGNNELWSYDSFNDNWSQKQNQPNGLLIRNMVINNVCYMLFRLQDNSVDFYSYDASNDTWNLINHYSASDPPMNYISSGSWLGYGSTGYSLTNYINGFDQPIIFIFNSTTKIWDKRMGPFSTEGTGELQFGFSNYIYTIYKKWISGDTYNFYLWNYDINKNIFK